MTVVRNHYVKCRLLVICVVCVTLAYVITRRFAMVASRTKLLADDVDKDHPTLRKQLTPSTSDVVDLTGHLSSTSKSNDSIDVHSIWFFPPKTALRFHEALALIAIQRYARPRKILIWYDAASTPPAGRWWQFARKSVANIFPVPYQRPTSIFNQTVSVPEHQTDVARQAIIIEHGGLYIDLDVIVVRPLNSLFHFDVPVFGAETMDLLGSGFILARRPGAEFVRRWRQSYARGFDDKDWNHHACRIPMQLANRYPHLVHVEWSTIHRPNWYERHWLYTDGLLWNWSSNFAIHLWFRTHPKNITYDPISIRSLNTTTGQVFRHIYYGDTRLLPPVVTEPPTITGSIMSILRSVGSGKKSSKKSHRKLTARSYQAGA